MPPFFSATPELRMFRRYISRFLKLIGLRIEKAMLKKESIIEYTPNCKASLEIHSAWNKLLQPVNKQHPTFQE